jgi:hypothetical protein
MELVRHTDLLLEKWAVRIGVGFSCLAALMTLFIWTLLILEEPKIERTSIFLPTPPLDTVGQGPLALSPPLSKELQPLMQELILIGANTRPDQEISCSLALRSSAQEKTISLGETLFLELKEGQLVFSDVPTELGIKARSLENNILICDINHQNSRESCTLHSSAIFSHSLDQESYIEILKKGAVWGKDVFLSEWGGEEYKEMTSKAKISIGPDVYFLKPGDCLYWNGEMWTHELESDEIGPIAQVIKTSSEGTDFQVWNSSGFSSEAIHLETQTPPKSSLRIDEVITAIRPRSPTEITCQLGKRRVIVREGDWWIRLDDRWKPVRTIDDLDACLNHQIAGELYIFEKIEASVGKVILQGRAFDRMRTFSEPVSLVLQTDKKPHSLRRSATGSPAIAKHHSQRPVISHSIRKGDDL